MPRTGRGGKRTGNPGKAYPERRDLNIQPRRATTPADAVYGSQKKQEAVAAAGAAGSAAPMPRGRSAQPSQGMPPGSLAGLLEPSARPGEPVTAGLPMGEGPGPEALAPMPVVDNSLYDLRALAARFPEYKDLHRLILRLESEM